jgi:hypothetical protein
MSDAITILRAHGRRLAKVIHDDGTIDNFDKAKTFDLTEVSIDDLDAALRLLRRLERRSDCCVVRGAIADVNRTKGVRRICQPDREYPLTLREQPRRWVALDIDSLPIPNWIDPVDLIACACVAIRALPKPFRVARCIVQATASHGLKPGARLRLWFWLSRPVSSSELKFWLRLAPVDHKIFGAAQIHYTAAPLFLSGASDPLPKRIDIIPGDEAVLVPRPARLKPQPRIVERHEGGGGNIDHLVHFVAHAYDGNRNAALYWAARRAAEQECCDDHTAQMLEAAAIQAGLSPAEAAATVRSGLRHG